MKHLFFLIVISSVLSCKNEINHSFIEQSYTALELNKPSITKYYNTKDFKQKHGVFYYLDKPFSGDLVRTYNNGNVKSNSSYVNGKLEHLYRAWHSDGSLKFEKQYLNGNKNGEHKAWYSNGQLKYKHNFNNDLFEGVQLYYYENGNLSMKKQYVKGKEIGAQRSWNREGKLTSNYIFRNNRRFGLVGRNDCVSVVEK